MALLGACAFGPEPVGAVLGASGGACITRLPLGKRQWNAWCRYHREETICAGDPLCWWKDASQAVPLVAETMLAQAGSFTDQASIQVVDVEIAPAQDGGDEEIPLPALLFMLVWISVWNTATSSLLAPGLESLFKGEIAQGMAQLLLACLCPHVMIGFYMPYLWFGFPLCLIGYWPFFLMAYKTSQEVNEEEGDVPARRFSMRQSVEELVEQHRNPAASVAQRFSNNALPREYLVAQQQLAQECSECFICHQALPSKPVGVLMADGVAVLPQSVGAQRVCRHYFHQECLERFAKLVMKEGLERRCPICQTSFCNVQPFPELSAQATRSSVEDWFYLASCGNDHLEQEHLITALGAVVPLRPAAIEAKAQELCSPLGRVILPAFEQAVPAFADSARGLAPPGHLTQQPTTKQELFDALDTRHTGKLDCAQLVRGIGQLPSVQANCSGSVVESAVYHIYRIFYQQKGGVDTYDFCKSGGFFDQVCLELNIMSPFF